MFVRKLGLAFAVAASAAALATPAHAAQDLTEVTVTAGTLDFGTAFSAANFPAVQLDGTVKTVAANVANWSVNDARGSLVGWNVTIAASPFTDAVSGAVLPAGTLSLTAPTVTAGSGQASTLKPTAAGPAIAAIDAGTVPFIAAAPLTGQGLWNFTQGADQLSLTIPSTVLAGTYSSTITTTLSSL
jgi:hypothetical protein